MKRLAFVLFPTAVVLSAASPAVADPSPSPAASSDASTSGGPPPSSSSSGSNGGLDTQHVAALVGVGVAVVGFTVAAIYGGIAISRKNEAQSACPGSYECATAAGAAKWNSAESAATDSTFAFVVGCIGALEAAVFWFTPSSNSSSSASTQVGLGPASFQIKGTW